VLRIVLGPELIPDRTLQAVRKQIHQGASASGPARRALQLLSVRHPPVCGAWRGSADLRNSNIRPEQSQKGAVAVDVSTVMAAWPAAMWATAVGPTATAVGCAHRNVRCPAAVRATSHRAAGGAATMGCGNREMRRAAAMRTAAVKCWAAAEPRSAMSCRDAMETRSAAGCRPAMDGRHPMERRFTVRCGRASVDRSRAETPDTAARCLIPDARRRRQRGNPGSIEARSRGRVGIGDAAAMGGIMHPYAT
jgi:hypothetical protein